MASHTEYFGVKGLRVNLKKRKKSEKTAKYVWVSNLLKKKKIRDGIVLYS